MSNGDPVYLRMPRVNANEDAATIVAIRVAPGQEVRAGDPLFDIETTKATAEVAAPGDASVMEVLVAEGDQSKVGARLCKLALRGPLADVEADLEYESADGEGGAEGGRQVSKKAELRAKELGVDIDAVPASGGRVRVKDVEDYAASNRAPDARRAPLIRERYRATDAIMIGGGGHARILLDVARGSGWNIIGCLDKSLKPGTRVLGEIEVLGPDEILEDLFERGVRAAVLGASGSPVDSSLRRRIFSWLKDKGLILPPLVHRAAHLALGAEIGEAAYLCAGAQVGSQAFLGDGVIVNTNASVAHDSVIGDHCHLTPNAIIAGSVRIGSDSTIGMGATIMNNVVVGKNCLIHNNATVVQDVPDGTVVRRD